MALQAPRIVQALRAPHVVQRLAGATLSRLERRWPTLARLLGRIPYVERVERVEHVTRVERVEMALDPRTTAALIAALRDPSAEVAVDAAEMLRSRPGPATVEALREVLANREGYFNGATRAAAVLTLGALSPAGDLAAVYGALADVDATVSLSAIAAIVDRADDGCAEALLKLLEDGSGFYLPPTRRAAARGLDRIRSADPTRVKALLDRESDAAVRDALTPMSMPS
jgi:HEAT repeat protein